MYLDTIKLINEYQIKEFDQSRLKSPLMNNEIDKFKKESQIALQYTPCDEYLDFLRLTNGFVWNGITFNNSEDFLYENIDNRKIRSDYKKFIVFGSSGSTEIYTYNTEKKTFNIADAFELDDDFESFKTFGELIIGIFQESYDAQLSGSK